MPEATPEQQDTESQIIHLLEHMMASYRDVVEERQRGGDETAGGDFAAWLNEHMADFSNRMAAQEEVKFDDAAWEWLADSPKDPSKLTILQRLVEMVETQAIPEPKVKLLGATFEVRLVYTDKTVTSLAGTLKPEQGIPMTDGMLVPNLRAALNNLVDAVKQETIDGLKEKSVPATPQQAPAAPPPKKIVTPDEF
jgi:hypothetical protein